MFHFMPSDMNASLKFRRLVWFQSINLKSLSLVLVLGTTLFGAGCGKKKARPRSAAPEHHGAEGGTADRDTGAAEGPVLHGLLLLRRSTPARTGARYR